MTDEERSNALEAAYRLGGVEAVRELLTPGEVVLCPLCGKMRDNWTWDPKHPTRGPLFCELCKGSGWIRRTKPTGDYAYDQDTFEDKVCALDWRFT